MNNNKSLIKICIAILTFARFAAILGLIVMVGIGIFNNVDDYFTLNLSREYMAQTSEGAELMVKPKYDRYISDTQLLSTMDNYKVSFSKGVRGVIVVCFLIITAGSIYAIHLLLQFMKSALERQFFTIANVIRIRTIGLMLVGIGAFYLLLNGWINYVSSVYFEKGTLEIASVQVSLSPDIFHNSIFVGLIVLIVSQVFEYGLKLEEEQDLTI